MKAAIVSVDTLIYQKLKEDDCAPIVKRMLGQVSFRTELIQPVPNDKEVIRKVLARIADAEIADLVLTIGGIGCRDEDWTPGDEVDPGQRNTGHGRSDAAVYGENEKARHADQGSCRNPEPYVDRESSGKSEDHQGMSGIHSPGDRLCDRSRTGRT